jgi:hydroxyacylglutathione hydrolase
MLPGKQFIWVELISENIFLIKNEYKFASNTYILKDPNKDDCILIDPGLDGELIIQAIQNKRLNPIAIFSTHGHFDHIGTVAVFQRDYGVPFYLHQKDLKLSRSANFYLKLMGLDHQIEIASPDFLITEEVTTVRIGNLDLKIFLFPGHSPGSCLIQSGEHLFSGDIFFKHGLGLGTIPKEDSKSLKASIEAIISNFSGEMWVLPGHGDCETLGNIIKNNVSLNLFLGKQNGDVIQ